MHDRKPELMDILGKVQSTWRCALEGQADRSASLARQRSRRNECATGDIVPRKLCMKSFDMSEDVVHRLKVRLPPARGRVRSA